ncbi:MAG: homoserine O-succinyltransferase [Lachnospiraceae bacterium]|nr:homoserine O-succinyltransferase [Lachnospiraceae bacterium]
MPIKIQSDLPAREILEHENIFVMDEYRAMHQDMRPLQICILNLMPIKQDTELHLLRSLSNTPLQVDVTFMKMNSHVSLNTSTTHLDKFYNTFDELKENKYDGLIITGAPVEQIDFEDVDYWPELCEIMEWSKTHVHSTFHICWGAQAGLYYHFGLDKVLLHEKMFGVYEHRVLNRKVPLVRGFDDIFYIPHSRHTATPAGAIHSCDDLVVMAESDKAGVFLCMTKEGKQIFAMGHPEYDRYTLHNEYVRDVKRGLPIHVPENYYPNDDPTLRPILSWRSHCNILYTNWLNYYVYQTTPYDIREIGSEYYI